MGYSSYSSSYFQPIPENSNPNVKKRSFDMIPQVSSIPVYHRHNSHNDPLLSSESNWITELSSGDLSYSEPATPSLMNSGSLWTYGSDVPTPLQEMKLEGFEPTLDMASLVPGTLPKQESFGLVFPFDDFECRAGSFDDHSNMHLQSHSLIRSHPSTSPSECSQSFSSIHDSSLAMHDGMLSNAMDQRQLRNIQFNRVRMASENHSEFSSSMTSPVDSGFCTPIDSYTSSPVLHHSTVNTRSYFPSEYIDTHRRPSISTGLQSLHMADEMSLNSALSMTQASSSLSAPLSINSFLDANHDIPGALLHSSDPLGVVNGHFYNNKLHLDQHSAFMNPTHEDIMSGGGGHNSTYGFHDGAPPPPTLSPPSSPNTENRCTPVSPANGLNYSLGNKIELSQNTHLSLKPLVHSYVSPTTNPLLNGEKTVVILTSKVAQKSYGTEKRFLCPPPTVLLLGQNWRVNTFPKSGSPNEGSTLVSPKLTIGIPGESGQQQGVLEWSGPSSPTVDSNAPESTSVGRCVAKHLFINDADEKRKRVEVMVNVQSSSGQPVGTFVSKPIKVISKPSKKRQSVKNMELCIHHGTTISLFNRIRSQTVSTKYLGVSSPSASTFGNAKWPANMNHIGSPSDSACFVARTGRWDPFVIWLVDLNKRNLPPSEQTSTLPPPGFPAPPTIAVQPQEYAMSFSPGSDSRVNSDGKSPIPIHYNQPVVLQCLSTGLISPVMIIRKVDKGSLVVGTGTGTGREEMLGDPVSQLHKVAFQIVEDMVEEETPFPIRPTAGSYLVCLGDVVGVQRSNEGRKFDTPSAKKVPSRSESLPNVLEHSYENLPNGTAANEGDNGTRKRRAPTSAASGPPMKASKAGRRNSIREDLLSGNDSALQNMWSEDVSDTAVWTIVGTDCVQYSFYTPNSNTHGDESSINPITPIPYITHIIPSTQSGGSSILSIYGENLTADLSVWFGETQSKVTEFKSRESIVCAPPAPGQNGAAEETSFPILLVRSDGVVFKTGKFYTV
ncbi:LAG1-DNAbind-domain-containing protein [Basidiobolus meristosporus CBS 931.73]|uniref:LAG1-DNAbind-domain-containing protein n=1 Tax=Basidiobolus meristosporus CBS 931.73 TaxID=1314790 RepID=A0A1Y1YLN6_9FUNG|nr:LAG1-DNAbind-domain-containing protein [Basidiobolus meristosporus CBS 931.73]|eukprot:ORX98743.1 LAG1-DNAbind-domain-containing protein [Basidiobolus meristosporus CBS 931.73]